MNTSTTVCEYTQSALDFLESNNTTLVISQNGSGHAPWSKAGVVFYYRVSIITPLGNMQFPFYGSIRDFRNNQHINAYDVLGCLSVDYSEDFDDFCAEYGYDKYNEDFDGPNKEALKVYKKVVKQSEDLTLIFTDEQLDQLHEIN